MPSKLLIFFVLIGLTFCLCKNNKSQVVVKSNIEEDKGDSIIYYKDFDLFRFKGINKLNPDSLSYPFVKMVYRNDSLVLKAHYNESKTGKLLLFKLNSQWCNHSHSWSDGVTSHHFLIFSDTALYEFKFLRNPYGNTAEDLKRPATLYSITVESKNNGIIKYRYYQSFDWGSTNYKVVPDVSNIIEKDWLKNCQSLIIGHDYVKDDTLRKFYQSHRRIFRDGKYQEFENDGDEFLIQVPLKFDSEFYTRLLSIGE